MLAGLLLSSSVKDDVIAHWSACSDRRFCWKCAESANLVQEQKEGAEGLQTGCWALNFLHLSVKCELMKHFEYSWLWHAVTYCWYIKLLINLLSVLAENPNLKYFDQSPILLEFWCCDHLVTGLFSSTQAHAHLWSHLYLPGVGKWGLRQVQTCHE